MLICLRSMRTLEDYIVAIDEKSAGIVCYLRSVILSCSKSIEEKTTHNSPTYYNKNFPLCNLQTTNYGVDIAFSNAEKICDPFKLLSKTSLGDYRIAGITSTKQIDAYQLILLVQQAMLANELKEIMFKYELLRLS